MVLQSHIQIRGSRKPIPFGLISAIVGSHKFDIETDVLDNYMPLLFSKSSMKRANRKLNFQYDMITIFNTKIPLITTQSRNYAIPIAKAKQLINNIDRETNIYITLTLWDSKDNHSILLKLHRQFANPSKEKL